MANHGVGFHRLLGGTTNQSKQGVMMNHKHEPRGFETVLVPLNSENYSMISAQCQCGITLIKETAPKGARYNWEDWRVSK